MAAPAGRLTGIGTPASGQGDASRSLLAAAAVCVAMVAFGLFAHRGMPWLAVSAAGLLASATVIGRSLRQAPRPIAMLGFTRHEALPLFAVLGVVVGTIGGLSHGRPQGVPLPPAGGVHPFVLLACLIGAMEELVYRGWLYGRAARYGWPVAVLVAAVAHAAYKAALFALPPAGLAGRFDLAGMFAWTVFGGLVAGGLRAWSRSVVPAVLAHVAFDAVVYAGLAQPPWWVWR